ncbi:hypothetical protein AURANDRAFT_72904, partial [Aureococcus anophagefferens]
MDMSLREQAPAKLAKNKTRGHMTIRFRAFLESDKEQIAKIRAMCANNLASFEISYQALSSKVPILAIWVADAPRSILSCRIFDEVANELVLSSDHFPKYCAYPPCYIHLWMTLYPRLGEIKDEIHVRVRDLPITDTLRDLRQTHLNQLVRVSGVGTCCVERSTLSCIIRFPGRHTTINDIPTIKDGEIHLWLLSSNFGTIQAKQHRGGCYYVPFYSTSSSLWVKPSSCPCCQQAGPFTVNQEQT